MATSSARCDDSDSGISSSIKGTAESQAREGGEACILPDTEILPNHLGSPLVLTSEQPSQLGTYRLGREIGRGGMGIVYEATESSLGRRVAIKVLPPSSQMDKMQALRFANESRAAAQLNHPNIVPIYSVGEENGVSYFAMRLIEGQDLGQVLKVVRHELFTDGHKAKQGTHPTHHTSTADNHPLVKDGISPDQRSGARKSERMEYSAGDFQKGRRGKTYSASRGAANKVAQMGVLLADALQHAHDAGVIHRDIKPRNIMLDNEGKLWVTDFGLAQIKDTPSLTQTGLLVGTLRYMSPEQAAGIKGIIDHRTDIYSLGVTLCEILVLKPVVGGKTTQEIVKEVIYGAPIVIRRMDSNVPFDLAVILEKAMSRNPRDRYNTASEMADDLTRFLNNQPIRARRPSLLKRSQQWLMRHRAITATLLVAMVGTLFVSLAAAGVVWNALLLKEQQREQTAKALTESEGLRLLANAGLQLPENPGLSLALAIEGTRAAPGIEADASLKQALDANHEQATVYFDGPAGSHVSISPDGLMIVSCVDSAYVGKGAAPAMVYRSDDGGLLRELKTDECITSAAFSSTGEYIVTTSAPAPASSARNGAPMSEAPVLWEAASGKKLKTLSGMMTRMAHPTMFSPSRDSLVLSRENDAAVCSVPAGDAQLVLRGHTQRVTYAEFSPDGDRILTVSDDGTVRIWSSTEGIEVRPPIPWNAPGSESVQAAFTAGSGDVVVTDRNGVSLFATELHAEASADAKFTSRHMYAAVSRSHDHVALFSRIQNIVSVVSSRTFSPICELELSERPQEVLFHPAEKQLLAICQNRMFQYRSESGESVGELAGHGSLLISACQSRTKGIIASVANDRTLRIWKSRSGAMENLLTANAADTQRQVDPPTVATNNDGTRVAVAARIDYLTSLHGYDGKRYPGSFRGKTGSEHCQTKELVTVLGRTVFVNEALTSRELYRGEFSGTVDTESRLLARQRKLLVNTVSDTFLVDIAGGSRVRVGGNKESVLGVASPPDESFILLTTSTGRCISIDPANGRELWSRPLAMPADYLECSLDGNRGMTIDRTGRVEIFGSDDGVVGSTFSLPAKHRAIFLYDSSRVICWNPYSRGKLQCRLADNGNIESEVDVTDQIVVRCHPAKPLVACGGREGAFLWNVETNESTTFLKEPCRSLAIVDDRVAFLTGTRSSMVLKNADSVMSHKFLIHLLEDQSLVHQEELTLSAWAIQADSENERFAITQEGFPTDVFSPGNGEIIFQTAASGAPALFSSFTNRGDLIVVSADGTVCISDDHGNTRSCFRSSLKGIRTAALSPDQKILLTADLSGDLIVWDVEAGREVSRLSGHGHPVEKLRFDASGFTVVSVAPDDPIHVWDLRTSQASIFSIPNAKRAEIAPNGQQLLVVAGNRGTADAKAYLVNVSQKSVDEITQPGGTVQAMFSPSGKEFCLLGATSDLEICSANSREPVAKITRFAEATKRFTFLSDTELITDHLTYLNGWEIPSGKLSFQHQKTDRAYGGSDQDVWRPVTNDNHWLIEQSRDVRTIPRHPFEEALKRTPRPLTDDERRLFRLDLRDSHVKQH